jgi:hypothetical protein
MSATLETLVNFTGADGEFPSYENLIADAYGDLFGTASHGGTNDGTAFEITASGFVELTTSATESVSGLTNQTSDAITVTASTVVAGGGIASVAIYDGSTLLGDAASNNNGTWSYTASVLAGGGHSFSATVTDSAGNMTMATLAPVTVMAAVSESAISDSAVTTGSDGNSYINAANFNGGSTTLTGQAEAGDTVAVSVNGGAASAPTVAADGSWSYAIGGLTDGESVSAVATATDAASDTATSPTFDFTVDTGASEQAALSLTIGDTDIGAAAASNVAFSVAGLEPDDTGAVTFTDSANNTVTVNVAGGQTGYTANLSALDDGPITSSLQVAADPAGNSFTPVAGNPVTLDQDLGEQAALSLTIGDTDIGAAAASNVAFSVAGLEPDDTGAVTFTDSANDTVTVNVAGGQTGYTANLSALDDGPIGSSLQVAADPAGNTFTPVAGNAVTLATERPTASATESVSGLTSQTSDTITVTASAEAVTGDSVTGVEIYDGTTDLGAATSNGDGTWSSTASGLADGNTYDFSAAVTDAADNQTTATLAPVTVATQPPTASATESMSGLTNHTSDTITVTASAEAVTGDSVASVAIYDGGGFVGVATYNSVAATWSYTAGGLEDGDSYAFSALVTDAAGNSYTTAALPTVTVATQEPVVPVATYLGDTTYYDDLAGGFSILYTAANVAASFDALNVPTDLNSITFTDTGTPTLTLSLEEALNDTRALGEITSQHTTIVSGTAAAMEALTTGEANTLFDQGYTLAVDDTAAHIRAMTVAQAEALSARDVTQANSSNATVALRAAQVAALEAAKILVSAPSGDTVTISDTAAHLEGLTATKIGGLTAIGVTGLVSSNATVALRVAQAKALETAGIAVSAPSGDTVTISDTAAHLEGLTASKIGGLTAIGVTGLVSTNANVSYSPAQTAAIFSSGLTVSALGDSTVTENFADSAHAIAYFNVTGEPYSSYEDIYNSAGTLVADAQNNVDGSGSLLLNTNALTVTSSQGSESVTTGANTFAINPHTSETTTATGRTNETFVFGAGFGQDALAGFLATGSTHDLLQFSASMFGLSSKQPSKDYDAMHLLNNSSFASGTTNAVVITDQGGDTLTLNGVTLLTLKNNLADFNFT